MNRPEFRQVKETVKKAGKAGLCYGGPGAGAIVALFAPELNVNPTDILNTLRTREVLAADPTCATGLIPKGTTQTFEVRIYNPNDPNTVVVRQTFPNGQGSVRLPTVPSTGIYQGKDAVQWLVETDKSPGIKKPTPFICDGDTELPFVAIATQTTGPATQPSSPATPAGAPANPTTPVSPDNSALRVELDSVKKQLAEAKDKSTKDEAEIARLDKYRLGLEAQLDEKDPNSTVGKIKKEATDASTKATNAETKAILADTNLANERDRQRPGSLAYRLAQAEQELLTIRAELGQWYRNPIVVGAGSAAAGAVIAGGALYFAGRGRGRREIQHQLDQERDATHAGSLAHQLAERTTQRDNFEADLTQERDATHAGSLAHQLAQEIASRTTAHTDLVNERDATHAGSLAQQLQAAQRDLDPATVGGTVRTILEQRNAFQAERGTIIDELHVHARSQVATIPVTNRSNPRVRAALQRAADVVRALHP